jgi:hypothetical protein
MLGDLAFGVLIYFKKLPMFRQHNVDDRMKVEQLVE